MSKILLRPIPEMQFHLRWWHGGVRPICWKTGYYQLADGEYVNLPEVHVRKWHPGYWLLSWRIYRHGKALVRDACPQGDKMVYEAYRGSVPNMATQEEVADWVSRVNKPYDWPYRGAD